MLDIASKIEEGAITFLKAEYLYLSIFVIVLAIFIFFFVEPVFGTFYTTLAFLVGGFTSILCGYIGMRVAVHTNVRVTKLCTTDIASGFVIAFRGGEVLGFILVGIAILVFIILIEASMAVYAPKTLADYTAFFDLMAGYGLGGSFVALFGRVGGGIYTKAADVGSDLAGKVVEGLPEDSPKNPGVVADNVGDNVGDIAGMGADLFGSLAESTTAALVVGGYSAELIGGGASMYFPLLITSSGIIVSFLTQFVATNMMKATYENVESVLKWQLIISTVLMTAAIIPICLYVLPESFTYGNLNTTVTTNWDAFGCICVGLWAGLIIGWITEVYTSNTYSPVRELTDSCRLGAAPNIILGLALGYMSTVVPIVCIAVTIYLSFHWAYMYGIALAALGMLSTLPIALSIDGYGPIADNAGGIAEMTGLDPSVRRNTDKLDAAGNTTAAIGKGFAIGSACLVALALFGAFVAKTGQTTVNILAPLQFAGLILGAMIPYAFSALTMSAVGDAAQDMIKEIQRQFSDPEIKAGTKDPDYETCIAISTKASLKKMAAPGLLIILTPIVIGLLFGPNAVAGLLAGEIASGVQIAFSFSNTGGAWDNCKKYIEAGNDDTEGQAFAKHTPAHQAAVVGDTVGDPLKDTSGPSINIVMKLSSILSLVFGNFFRDYHLLSS